MSLILLEFCWHLIGFFDFNGGNLLLSTINRRRYFAVLDSTCAFEAAGSAVRVPLSPAHHFHWRLNFSKLKTATNLRQFLLRG